MIDHGIGEIAERMIRRYGLNAAAMMDARSCECERNRDIGTAAFWRLVAERIRASPGTDKR